MNEDIINEQYVTEKQKIDPNFPDPFHINPSRDITASEEI